MDHEEVARSVDSLEKLAANTEERGDTTGTAVLASCAILVPLLHDIVVQLFNIEVAVRSIANRR